jgi:hypothetical protein
MKGRLVSAGKEGQRQCRASVFPDKQFGGRTAYCLALLIKPDVQRLFSGSPTQDVAPDHDEGRRRLE